MRSAAERPLSTNMSRPLSTNISRPSKPATAVPAQPSSSSTYRPSSSSSSSSGAVSSSTSPDNSGAGAGANWMSPSQHTRSVQPHPQSPVPAHVQTKHDQAAALMGLLAASGLTMDSLFAMGEEKQREALIAAATKNNSSRHSDPSTGATGTNGNSKSSGGSGNASISGTATEKNGSDHRSTSDSGNGTTNSDASSSSSSSVPAPPKAVAADPRKAMMEMLAKRSKAASGESAEEAPPAPPAASSSVTAPASKGTGGVKLKDDPKYSKYFKMIKVHHVFQLSLTLHYLALLPDFLLPVFPFALFFLLCLIYLSLLHFFLSFSPPLLPPIPHCSAPSITLSTPHHPLTSHHYVGGSAQTCSGAENVFRRGGHIHRCRSGIAGPGS